MRKSFSDTAKAKLLDEEKKRKLYLAPWHFQPDARMQHAAPGEWTVVKFGKGTHFRDAESKAWIGFPPPNYNPQDFKDQEVASQWKTPQARAVEYAGYYGLPKMPESRIERKESRSR